MINVKKLAILIPVLLLFSSFSQPLKPGCNSTSDGPAINWAPELKLTWTDFKARKNPSIGFAVAASTCGFGYEGIINGNEVTVDVYVRFYCNESWYHKDYRIGEILKHEQLHFDICELYGRILYKNILFLRKSGSLNERTLKKLLYKLRDEYDAMQDRYDAETNHSTNGKKQREWNEWIKLALYNHSVYANYKEL